MLNFKVITVQPELINVHFEHLPFKRALYKSLISTEVISLRNFALDSYGTIDDKPFGGGIGMILMVEPLHKALLSIYPEFTDTAPEHFLDEFKQKYPNHEIIIMDPKGSKYNQKTAVALGKLDQIVFICGRYEGIDERIASYFCTQRISIGDYVLSGGEIPALAIMESITRLIPGSIEKTEAVQDESFSKDEEELEYPQYTRPEDYKGLKAPDILLSGNHKKIAEWKEHHRFKK